MQTRNTHLSNTHNVMRHIIITFTILLSSLTLSANGDKYMQAMGEALQGYATCETVDDYRNLANRFAVISKVAPEEWIPVYYQAHSIIVANFNSQEDAATRDQWLDTAQALIDRLNEMKPGEVEVQVLQGMLYTSRLVVDPQSRGQQFGAMSGAAIGKALAMDPMNPRAQYMMLSNQRGTAAFFGKDLTPFCAQAQELLDRWDSYEGGAETFYPSWGKGETTYMAQSCK
jgi:hypothetical protein